MRQGFVILALFVHGVSLFATSTWNVDADGDWSTSGNWSGEVPNATDAVAVFGSKITQARTVTLTSSDETVGTVKINSDQNYTIANASSHTLTMDVGSGTAAITVSDGNGTHTISAPLVLSDPLVVTQDSSGTFTLSGIISGSKSVTKAGGQTLVLDASNTYSGGTTVNAGTLSISVDGNLGNTSGGLTIGSATLKATAGVSSARTVTLSGDATINTGANTVTLSGAIGESSSGAGSLSKTGSGTLSLSGTNTYTGGTTVSAGTLQGNTDSLTGNISNSGTVEFNQTSDGTYSGVISESGALTKTGAAKLILTGANTYSGKTTVSAGTLQGNASSLPSNIANSGAVIFNQTSDGTYSKVLSGTGTLTKEGSGKLVLSGTNTLSGATTISAGNLQVTGSLSSSAIGISSGATLSGTGTVGTVTSTGGTISPGTSIGTLAISGNLTLDGNSTTVIEVSPTTNDLITVTGTANLDGTLSIQPQSGFYGFNVSYTILTASTVSGTFATTTNSNSSFTSSLAYSSTAVQITISDLTPFSDFPFSNSNTKSVGNNLDAISSAGTLTTDLVDIVNSFVGASFATINDALDQMQPSQVSAFAQLQSAVGAQILSIYQRRPKMCCGCCQGSSSWVHPFGDWLVQQPKDMQIGFRSHTWGLAFGFDTPVSDNWAIGAGGVWNQSELSWHQSRGQGDTHGLYGALYSDYMAENSYFGFSVLAGKDWYDMARHIHFTTIDRKAISETEALDVMGQLSAAYFFGSPACHLYPFANVDALYLRMESFVEREAGSLNLAVQPYGSLTLRGETGMGLEVIDKNYGETICISPIVALGWTLDWPLMRDPFVSTFQDQTIPFQTKGWREVFQLFTARFGLSVYVNCVTFSAEYLGEFSTDNDNAYENQRANLRINYRW